MALLDAQKTPKLMDQNNFRAGARESTSWMFETPKSTRPGRARHTKGAENERGASGSVPGRSKRISPKSRSQSIGPIGASLTHSHSAGLRIVLANDEGKQEHDARRNGQYQENIDVSERLHLPSHSPVKQTVGPLGRVGNA